VIEVEEKPNPNCFKYNVTVIEDDLIASDDDSVYFSYTNCDGNEATYVANNAGTFSNQFCGTNFSGAFYIEDGVNKLAQSSAEQTDENCI
jgi:hypothetical protein